MIEPQIEKIVQFDWMCRQVDVHLLHLLAWLGAGYQMTPEQRKWCKRLIECMEAQRGNT